MKEKYLLVLVFVCMCFISCSKSPIEQQLENYVVERSGGVDVKYKLKNYYFTDTITYSNAIDSLRKTIVRYGADKMSLEEFKEKRNREFVEYHRYDADYEGKIMRGELKDASPFCTEKREVTEMADSLINVWDDVDIDSYEYNYLALWYTNRMCQYWELSQQYEVSTLLQKLIEDKDQYIELKKLKQNDLSDIFEYHLVHEFSIYNPILKKRIELKELVTLDNNLKYKKSEDLNSFSDMMMQVLAK